MGKKGDLSDLVVAADLVSVVQAGAGGVVVDISLASYTRPSTVWLLILSVLSQPQFRSHLLMATSSWTLHHVSYLMCSRQICSNCVAH